MFPTLGAPWATVRPMPDIGEDLVGAYLREIVECPVVQFNVRTGSAQGEIDPRVLENDHTDLAGLLLDIEASLGLFGGLEKLLGRIREDRSDFVTRHEPGHPAADDSGHVKYPNVNSLIESADMREAQRSYEANINVIGATRRMVARTLEILRA